MGAPDGRETWLVVDGNNLLMRATRAMERSNLSAHGVPTGPLVAFVNSLTQYVRVVDPARMVVCWDGGHVYRTRLLATYKQGRRSRGYRYETVGDPFSLAKEFLTLSGIHHVLMPGVEADDLVAYYCQNRDQARVVILSGDKDLLQLLSGDDDVTQFRLGDKFSERWTVTVRSELRCRRTGCRWRWR
jgi:5'-3' exonuclease